MNPTPSLMPPRIAALPRDDRGYPIPRFVMRGADGKPDFRVTDAGFWARAVSRRLCWICGQALGRHVAFVCGPSTAVTHVTSEPGSHLDCAEYALRTCPFIVFPNRRRDQDAALDAFKSKSTVMIERNPGVWILWVTSSFTPFQIGDTVRIRLGDPTTMRWLSRGGPATLAQAAEGVSSAMTAVPEASREPFRRYLAAMKAED